MSKQENYIIGELLKITLEPFKHTKNTSKLRASVDAAMEKLNERLPMYILQWRIERCEIEAEVRNLPSARRKYSIKVPIVYDATDSQYGSEYYE